MIDRVISYTLEATDLLAAGRANFLIGLRGRISLTITIGLPICCAVIIIMALLAEGQNLRFDRLWQPLLVGCAAAILLPFILQVLCYFFIVPNQYKKVMRERKLPPKLVTFSWTDTSFTVKGDRFHGDILLSELVSWSEFAAHFVLRPSHMMLYIVPKRAFAAPNMMDDLRATLVRSGLPKQ